MGARCYCTPAYLCSRCEAGIDAAESEPVNDYRDDYVDNLFEKAMYPNQW